ncbi:MAG: phosphatase PAP2 family protein [Azoarcus sp.]|jgi:lipid A 4'-phosphatase|nr:phosphatase PAP2 family protein [Azoarcus sp.]
MSEQTAPPAPDCGDLPPAAARPRHIEPLTLAILLSMLAAMALFTLWPALDPAVSAFFYRPETHDFAGNHSALAMAVYRFIPLLARIAIVLIVIAFAIGLFIRGPRGRIWRIRAGFLAAALALGPGLVVDVILKDYFDRARPVKIIEFGGSARFTPAFVPGDQCDGNCSFVSGHASAGFFFASFGFLGGAMARRRWTAIGLALGGIAGLGRISQGGHFLSDVVFAFYFTWFSAWLVWRIFRKLGWLAAVPERRPPAGREEDP